MGYVMAHTPYIVEHVELVLKPLRKFLLYYFFCIWTLFKMKKPATVVERSKARTVFARPDDVIVGSNLTYGMDVWCVCLFCVCVAVCLSTGPAIGRSLVQDLPIVKPRHRKSTVLKEWI
jgi:hypothetical protein